MTEEKRTYILVSRHRDLRVSEKRGHPCEHCGMRRNNDEIKQQTSEFRISAR